MAITVQIGNQSIQLTAEPLTREGFAPFGDVVSNPRPDVHPVAYAAHGLRDGSSLPFNAVSANQGTAIQYKKVSRPQNHYDQAPSGKGELVMSNFVCAGRPLSAHSPCEGIFTVAVLERHPFTSQTFAPLKSSADKYLVIAAPSLPPAQIDEGFPAAAGPGLPGRGAPDLRGIKAFIATSRQGVTYAAGTWHAPMVAIGAADTELTFLVVQHSSGVVIEDVQYTHFESQGGQEPNIRVHVPRLKERLEKL